MNLEVQQEMINVFLVGSLLVAHIQASQLFSTIIFLNLLSLFSTILPVTNAVTPINTFST